MENLIELFGGIVYNNVCFTFLGLSGGSKQYPPFDYIPDTIIHLHRIELN